jgi:hypothetical protein
MRTRLAAAVLMVLAALPAGAADDDLTVVKRAVQDRETAAPAGASRGRARWFRVRIEERDGGKVKVNLPLPFVRALGEKTDGWPGGFRCGRDGGPCKLKLSAVLGALDGGQEFVTIDDEDASIRIWID